MSCLQVLPPINGINLMWVPKATATNHYHFTVVFIVNLTSAQAIFNQKVNAHSCHLLKELEINFSFPSQLYESVYI